MSSPPTVIEPAEGHPRIVIEVHHLVSIPTAKAIATAMSSRATVVEVRQALRIAHQVWMPLVWRAPVMIRRTAVA
jgi:hypothetical protein